MSNNNNNEMKDNKPLLWESWMTYQDYKTRQSFYNGTAQPKHSPMSQPPEDQEVLDIVSHESFDDYCDFMSFRLDAPKHSYRYEFEITDYAWCTNELFEYSIKGVASIDIYDN